jgi:hypothetical protein
MVEKGKSNLFYCNGNVPIIMACSIMRQLYMNDNNILILERNNKTDDKKLIEDCLVKNAGWSHIQVIDVNLKFVMFSDLAWPFSLIKYFYHSFFILKDRKKTVKILNNIIKKYPHINNYFFSDNSNMLKYVYGKTIKSFSYIEHGASSYYLNRFSNKRSLKAYPKIILNTLLGASNIIRPEKIYLSDGGRSLAVNQSVKNEFSLTPISLNISEEVAYVYKEFIKQYEVIATPAYNELRLFLNKFSQKTTYLYLPTEGVSSEEYITFLKKQLKDVQTDDSIFIIKPHSNDRNRNYKLFFSELGVNCFQFENKINLDIPAEFLLLFFKNIVLLGTYSSTHLYAKWWIQRRTIVSDVGKIDTASVRRHIEGEYKAVCNDF